MRAALIREDVVASNRPTLQTCVSWFHVSMEMMSVNNKNKSSLHETCF